jgi:hypothetical protein
MKVLEITSDDCCSTLELSDVAEMEIGLGVEVIPLRVVLDIRSDSDGDCLGIIEELSAWALVTEKVMSLCGDGVVSCVELGPRNIDGVFDGAGVAMGAVVFWKNSCWRFAIGCRLTPCPLASKASSTKEY